MNLSMNDSSGTVHLSYQYHAQSRLRERLICQMIEAVVGETEIPRREFSILDIGCGSGNLMKTAAARGLKVEGADIDPVCVKLSARYGETHQVGEEPLTSYFSENAFDCLVFSHSLEHFDDPMGALMEAKRISRRYLVVVVPNPCRLQTIFTTNPLRLDYSNLGHTCCWDRSHLSGFLSVKCGLSNLRWMDYKLGVWTVFSSLCHAVAGKRNCRQLLEHCDIEQLSGNSRSKKLRHRLRDRLEPLELSLGKLFPYLTDELMVLAEIPEKVEPGRVASALGLRERSG